MPTRASLQQEINELQTSSYEESRARVQLERRVTELEDFACHRLEFEQRLRVLELRLSFLETSYCHRQTASPESNILFRPTLTQRLDTLEKRLAETVTFCAEEVSHFNLKVSDQVGRLSQSTSSRLEASLDRRELNFTQSTAQWNRSIQALEEQALRVQALAIATHEHLNFRSSELDQRQMGLLNLELRVRAFDQMVNVHLSELVAISQQNAGWNLPPS